MTNYIIFANTDDGYLKSANATYATALSGGTMTLDNSSGNLLIGQELNAGTYNIYESFLNFDTSSVPTTEINVALLIKLTLLSNSGILGSQYGAPYNFVEMRTVAWTSALTTAQWKNPTTSPFGQTSYANQIGAQMGAFFGSQPQVWFSSPNNDCKNQVVNGGSTRIICTTNRCEAGLAPTGAEYATFASADTAGTTSDPVLLLTTVQRSTMRGVAKCQAQLSTGDVAAVVSDGGTTPVYQIGYYAKGSTSFTAIATVPTGTGNAQFSTNAGNETMRLVVNLETDDMYLIGFSGDTRKQFVAQEYTHVGSLQWSAKAVLNGGGQWGVDQPGQHLAACRLPLQVPTNKGFLWAQAMPEFESWFNYAALLSSDAPAASLLPEVLHAGSGQMINATAILWNGNLADTYPFDGGLRLSEAICLINNDAPITNLCLVYMSKNNAGVLTISWRVITFNAGFETQYLAGQSQPPNASTATLGGDSKMKVLQLSTTKFAIVFGQSSTQHSVIIVDQSGNGQLYSAVNINTMPDMSQSSNWDAVYDPGAQIIWLVYLDATNNRRLARIPFSVQTGSWSTTETQISTTVGAVGGTNDKLRSMPITINSLNTIYETSQRSSGGAYSTVAILDNLNAAPNAPSVANVGPFDATVIKPISWTFSDPNPGDTQLKYEIEIDNNTTSASAYRSGVVTSSAQSINLPANTLSNGITYRIRIRTYDSQNAQGAFSAYQTFTTAATGTITITSPNTDNPNGLIGANQTITWTYSGTQSKYRVQMIRVSDGTSLYDTGTITSAATSVTVPNVPSGVNVRMDVTITNNVSVVAGPVSRFLTTNYNGPDQITQVNVVAGSNSATVSWTIPTPTGSRPQATSFDVYRSTDGGVTWTNIVTLPAGTTTYTDPVVPANSTPQYVVRSNSLNGYTWSVTGACPTAISFIGQFINQMGSSTAANKWISGQNLYFGGPQNVETESVKTTQIEFAGRTYPVSEFGNIQNRSVAVTVTIPFTGNPVNGLDDNNYTTDASVRLSLETIMKNKSTVCWRDGRGRRVFGVITSLSFTDDPVGTKASFNVDAVDYAEGVTTTNVTT